MGKLYANTPPPPKPATSRYQTINLVANFRYDPIIADLAERGVQEDILVKSLRGFGLQKVTVLFWIKGKSGDYVSGRLSVSFTASKPKNLAVIREKIRKFVIDNISSSFENPIRIYPVKNR